MSTTTLWVRKGQLPDTRISETPDTPLAAGQVRVAVDHFALTSNNITYAAFGEAMHYWDFFPTPEPKEWGIVPVWGFGRVVQSMHPGVAVGERLYGYFPTASHAVLQPERLSAARFCDGAAHRAALPAVYNQYFRCAVDPLYTPDTEALQMLLRPLFITSWLIDDFLDDNDFFGARPGRVLLSSASSKTAFGTACLLHERPGIEVVGLTSEANRAFCESLGCYHRVLSYEALSSLDAQGPCVYVDFAGNAGLRGAIHSHFKNLRYSCAVGGTHVESLSAKGEAAALAGPRATLFFAPAQIKKRTQEWGADAFNERMAAAWRNFLGRVTQAESPWVRPVPHKGPAAAQAAYAQVLAGRGDPREGHILSL